MKNAMKLLAFLLGNLTPFTSAIASDPSTEWHKLETEHFEIIYDSRHYWLAKEYAKHAETAWTTLVPVFRGWPDKTVVVLDDTGDQANGMATGVPYPTIRLFPAPPNPGETIADTGPWNLELITHEYAHVLNFQPAHGIFHPLRNIFGSIVRPNLLLPRWYLEGLAVELETRFSPSGGRLRSPDFTAIPRAMTQDGVLRREDIARINEVSIPDFPGGARPYLMGALVWHELAERDMNLIGDLNEHFARRVPFFINWPLEERVDMSWQDFLNNVYVKTEERANAQIKTICEAGCNEGTKMGERGFYSRSPVLSPAKDKLAYLGREHNRDTVLMIASRSADDVFDMENAKRAAEPTSGTRVAWLPAGEALIYDSIESFGHYEQRGDLFVYDVASKKRRRLTRGYRAREADVAPSGKLIAFTQLTPGGTQIAVTELVRGADGKYSASPPRVVYTPENGHRVSWPTFVDDKNLIFVERTPAAKEGLRLLTLSLDVTDPEARKTLVRPLENAPDATFPRVVDLDDGSMKLKVVIFASAKNGVTNLYMAQLNNPASGWALGAALPLTNSTTRAWVGDMENNGDLIYSRLDGDGPHLRLLKSEDRKSNKFWSEAKLPKVEPLIDWSKTKTHVPPEVTLPPEATEAHDFNPWPYMLPRYWMPYAAFVPNGAFLSASTSSGDPLGRHVAAAALSTDTRIGKPNAFFAYSNSTTPVTIGVLGDDTWQRLSSSGFDRRTTTGDLSGLFYLPNFSSDYRAELGFTHQRSEVPLTTGTDVRIKGGPRIGLMWKDLSMRGREITPEDGGYARIAHTRYTPEFGNLVYDKTDLDLSANFSRASEIDRTWFGRLFTWLPERHALNLATNVSWAPGLDRLLLAPSSVSLPVETVALGSVSSSFVMRGYPTGSFLGRKYIRGTAEYHFPLFENYAGRGTKPFFFRRWHGVVFVDALTLEGRYFDFKRGYAVADIGNMFMAGGLEARLDMSILYHVPIQLIFGLHYGFDARINDNGAYPIVSISL